MKILNYLKPTFVLIFFLLLTFTVKSQVKAVGNDLTVSCSTSVCTVTEGDVPFFNELNITPGQTFTRKMTVKNATSQSGAFAITAYNLKQSSESASLANKIKVVIRRSSPVGAVVYGGSPKTLQNLIDEGFISLGGFSANQQDTFYFSAAVLDDIDNQYQNLSSVFDLDAGFEFIPVSPTATPTSAPSGGSNTNSGGGSDTSSSSQSSVSECTDTKPTSKPVLSFAESSTSDGQVTLQWTAVSGVSTYAVNFGTQPGVYLYGNNNVGNQTSYTVTNLVPGNKYYFQVLGINGCAPGPRSNEVSTSGTTLGLGATVAAPNGFSPQQVLGIVTDASSEAVASGSGTGNQPEILGAEACNPWKRFLPLVMLLIQVLVSLAIYVFYRNAENKVKHVGVVVSIIVCTAIFYYFRNCDCFEINIFAIFCKWYFVFAIALGVITQFLNYALIEREE